MIQGTLTNPQYIDLEKTKVSFTLTSPDGVISNAQLQVPANKARGVNPYWDYILDNFDIEQMRQARNQLELRRRRQVEFDRNKQKAAADNQRLVDLFNKKTKIFSMPFVASASDEVKSAIRRASDDFTLNFIYTDLLKKYVTDNNMTYSQMIDYFEDVQDSLDAVADSTPEANTTPNSDSTSA